MLHCIQACGKVEKWVERREEEGGGKREGRGRDEERERNKKKAGRDKIDPSMADLDLHPPIWPTA